MTSRNHLNPIMIDRLKLELQKLKEETSDALRQAIFLGMTDREATAHDERGRRKGELVRELSFLEQEQNDREES